MWRTNDITSNIPRVTQISTIRLTTYCIIRKTQIFNINSGIHRVQQDLGVREAEKGHPDLRVSEVSMELLDHLDQLADLVNLDHLVSQVLQEPKETKEFKDQRDLLDFKDLEV